MVSPADHEMLEWVRAYFTADRLMRHAQKTIAEAEKDKAMHAAKVEDALDKIQAMLRRSNTPSWEVVYGHGEVVTFTPKGVSRRTPTRIKE